MLKTLFGVVIVVWMMGFVLRYGLPTIPLLLIVALIVLLINMAIYRRSVHRIKNPNSRAARNHCTSITARPGLNSDTGNQIK